jgi:hypothetical protein
MIWVPAQVACGRVREMTILGVLFIAFATSGSDSSPAGGVTDEAWANAARHYDEEQLAALVFVIATINASNRMGVINRQAGGDYKPGQLGY